MRNCDARMTGEVYKRFRGELRIRARAREGGNIDTRHGLGDLLPEST
jgi:hypothetical protein